MGERRAELLTAHRSLWQLFGEGTMESSNDSGPEKKVTTLARVSHWGWCVRACKD